MDKELGIYISAVPEADAECELVGRLLAEMPRSVKWTIKRTPRPYEDQRIDAEALRQSQFYLIVLGSDIVAPMGIEWRMAQESSLETFAFRNVETGFTPAAIFFSRHVGASWHNYHTPGEFIRAFERSLITALIQGTPGYGLDMDDIEILSARLEALEDKGEETEDQRRGAGRGGVILSTD
ncbi:MAG: hypothetical protein U9R48_01205 [Chloroflexota bacterium]|nr:hypothetical protein [Chloroflexota bacterium]